jgi:hypothetical protein
MAHLLAVLSALPGSASENEVVCITVVDSRARAYAIIVHEHGMLPAAAGARLELRGDEGQRLRIELGGPWQAGAATERPPAAVMALHPDAIVRWPER